MSFYFVFVFRICLFCLENKTDTQILTAINEKIHEENQVFSLLILVYFKETIMMIMNSTFLEIDLSNL